MQPSGNSPVASSSRLNFELRLREADEFAPRPDPVVPLVAQLGGLEELRRETKTVFASCVEHGDSPAVFSRLMNVDDKPQIFTDQKKTTAKEGVSI